MVKKKAMKEICLESLTLISYTYTYKLFNCTIHPYLKHKLSFNIIKALSEYPVWVNMSVFVRYGASLGYYRGKASPAELMRDYLPVSDSLSIFASQTSLYLLYPIGSFCHIKCNGDITRLVGLT